jgi:coproporphyrinogen III oxidase-like Fe-S oxidoreductase
LAVQDFAEGDMLSEKFLQDVRAVVYQKDLHVPVQIGGRSAQMAMADVRALWYEFIERNRDHPEVLAGVQLYIHFPFCYRTKCLYCGYASHTAQGCHDERVKTYLQSLQEELEYFAPMFRGISLSALYIGGGTPSMMSTEQIDALLTKVNSHFSFQRNAERVFENSPISSTREKLGVCHNHGINRVSFGIQSLDAEILRRNNREFVPFDQIAHLIDCSRNLGIPYINADLMAGIDGVNEESLVRDFQKLASTPVTSITVYVFRRRGHQLSPTRGGERTNLDDFYEQAARQLEAVYSVAGSTRLRHFERVVNKADNHFFSFSDYPLRRYETRSTNRENVSTLGIGAESNSFLLHEYWYTQDPSIQSGWFGSGSRMFDVQSYSPSEQMGNYVANRLYGSFPIRAKEFGRIFGVDFLVHFRDVVSLLVAREWGYVNGDGDLELLVEGRKMKSLAQYLFYDKSTLEESLLANEMGVTAAVSLSPLYDGARTFGHKEIRLDGAELAEQVTQAKLNIDHHLRNGFTRIEISVGTVDEAERLPGFIAEMKRKGVTHTLLSTDAGHFSEFDFARQVVEAGVSAVRIPLYGSDFRTHEIAASKIGSSGAATSALENFRRLGVRVWIDALVLQQNKAELLSMFKLALQFADASRVSFSVPYIAGGNPDSYYVPAKQLREYVLPLVFYGGTQDTPVRLQEMPACVLGFDYANLCQRTPPRQGIQQPPPAFRSSIEDVPTYRLKKKIAMCRDCSVCGRCEGFLVNDIDRYGPGDLKPIPRQAVEDLPAGTV